MSDIIEKTLLSLPGFIQQAVTGGNLSTKSSKPENAGTGFNAFIQAFKTSKMKYEEELLMKNVLSTLKQQFSQQNLSQAEIRENVMKLVYCEIMGYHLPAAYIHVVNLAQKASLPNKRIGYLASSLFLCDNDELSLLIVNTIQRDLSSTNVLELCMALVACTHFISSDMAPLILPEVESKLSHPKAIVRKKALLALGCFARKDPSLFTHVQHRFRTAFGDKDTRVLEAVLSIYENFIQENPKSYTDLVPVLVHIQQQVLRRRFHMSYDYHGLPAPWIQLRLLRMFARLGAGDESSSQMMYSALEETIKSASLNATIAHAVLYEAIQTITSIHPNEELILLATKFVGLFVKSRNPNLSYIGIKSLSCIVQHVQPSYALEYQTVILDCLDHPDETINRMTVELLCKIVNTTNINAICNKITSLLGQSNDDYFRSFVTSNLCRILDGHAPSKQWHLKAVNYIMLKADAFMAQDTVDALYSIVEGGDKDLKVFAFNEYKKFLGEKNVPDRLLQFSAWVMGECANWCDDDSKSDSVSLLISQVNDGNSPSLQSACLTSVRRIALYCNQTERDSFVKDLENVESSLHEVCELQNFLRHVTDENCQNLLVRPEIKEMDFTLSFLDQFVAESLSTGCEPYKPRSLRIVKPNQTLSVIPSVESKTVQPVTEPRSTLETSSSTMSTSFRSNMSVSDVPASTSGLGGTHVKKVWSRDGIVSSRASLNLQKPSKSFNQKKANAAEEVLQSPVSPLAQQERQALASSLFAGLDAENNELTRDSVQSKSLYRSEGFWTSPSLAQSPCDVDAAEEVLLFSSETSKSSHGVLNKNMPDEDVPFWNMSDPS